MEAGSGAPVWTLNTLVSDPKQKLRAARPVGAAVGTTSAVSGILGFFTTTPGIVTVALVGTAALAGAGVGIAAAFGAFDAKETSSNAFLTPQNVKLNAASSGRRMRRLQTTLDASNSVEFTCTDANDYDIYTLGFIGIYSHSGSGMNVPVKGIIYDWKRDNSLGDNTYFFDQAIRTERKVLKTDPIAFKDAPINSYDDLRTRWKAMQTFETVPKDYFLMGCKDFAEYRDGIPKDANSTDEGQYLCGPRFVQIAVVSTKTGVVEQLNYNFEVYAEVKKFFQDGKKEGILKLDASMLADGSSCALTIPILMTNATGANLEATGRKVYDGIPTLTTSSPTSAGVDKGSPKWRLDTRFPNDGWTFNAEEERWESSQLTFLGSEYYKGHYESKILSGTMSSDMKNRTINSIKNDMGQSRQAGDPITATDTELTKMWFESFGPLLRTFAQHFVGQNLKRFKTLFPDLTQPSNVNDKLWEYAQAGLAASPGSL